MVGVFPRGPQLRLSGETKLKPDSSINTSVAWSARHFFYPWPGMTFPAFNRCLIPLEGQSLHFLTTPIHSIQQPPNTTGRVADPEQIPNQMSNAIQGPIIFAVSMSIGTSQQFLLQLFDMLIRYIGWLARRSLTFLLGRFLLTPTVDTPASDTKLSRRVSGC